MMDSVAEVHSVSIFDYWNQTFHLATNVTKNVCGELDSVQLLIISPSDFALDSLSLNGQDLTHSGDTLTYNALMIPAYQSMLLLLHQYRFDGIPSDTTYVFRILTVYGNDTTEELVPLPFSDSAANDLSISIYQSMAVAPVQEGFITGFVQPGNTAYQGVLPAAVSVTLPSWFTPDTDDLANVQIQDSTVTFTVVVPPSGGWFTVPFHLPGTTPAETPYTVTAHVNYPDDPIAANDMYIVSSVVMNSYDPNEKHMSESPILNTSVHDSLTYVVHFQNDGNYPAVDVTVRDTISPSLDLSTFRFLQSKHPCTYTIDSATREVVFHFSNIQLLPSAENLEASQGLFAYRIYENTNIAPGETILNTAYIYFDFNPPIITNTTSSVNQVLGLTDLANQPISMFPNPALDVLRFSGAQIQSLQIVDLSGKIVISEMSLPENELSLAGIDNGLYLVIIGSGTQVQTLRLSIRK
jgi:uncharacterized repeat protein (TIGR01451 family)